MVRKLETVKTMDQRKKQKTVYILGDSMIKKLNGYLFTKKVRRRILVKIHQFSGAKVSCMVDLVMLTEHA